MFVELEHPAEVLQYHKAAMNLNTSREGFLAVVANISALSSDKHKVSNINFVVWINASVCYFFFI